MPRFRFDSRMEANPTPARAKRRSASIAWVIAVAALAAILIVIATTPAPVFRVKVLLCAQRPSWIRQLDPCLYDNFQINGNPREFTPDQFIVIDGFAARALSKRWGPPVLISESENPGGKYLERYWRTPHGYLRLAAGPEIGGCAMWIDLCDNLPGPTDSARRQPDSPTLTKHFLDT